MLGYRRCKMQNSCRAGRAGQVQDRLHHGPPKWAAGALYSRGLLLWGPASTHGSSAFPVAIPNKRCSRQATTLCHALEVSLALLGPRQKCRINWHRLRHAEWGPAGMRWSGMGIESGYISNTLDTLARLVPMACDDLAPCCPSLHIGRGLQQEGSSACQPLFGTDSEQQSHWCLRAAGTGLSTSKGQGPGAVRRSLGNG